MMRRVLSVAMALLLVCTLPLTALAAEWNLVNGDITVSVDEGGKQEVSQNETKVEDDTPTIVSKDDQGNATSTSNTITVDTKDNTTANITIDNVNIENGHSSAIDVGDSNLNLTVKGENNSITSWGYGSIHVSSGSLTITGSGILNVGTTGDAAAIGSGHNEEMSGDITIKGDVNVDAEGDFCAAIGSGHWGDMSGNITIEGNAKVNAENTDSGAAIGSGSDGYVTETGSITIGGNADVTASSQIKGDFYGGAAIGSGAEGGMNGSITIEGNATVEANAGGSGAAIGTGDEGDIGETGTITIQGNTNVTATNGTYDGYTGAPIGTGSCGNMNGTIRIGNKATLNLNGGEIGAGTYGEVHGSIEYFIEPEDAVATADETATESAPLYRVVDEKENDLPFTETRKGGVLTIHCDRDFATFLTKTENLNTLKAQGIHTIVFETNGVTSTFALEDISGEGTLYLTHDGTTVTFTLDEKDISEILK